MLKYTIETDSSELANKLVLLADLLGNTRHERPADNTLEVVRLVLYELRFFDSCSTSELKRTRDMAADVIRGIDKELDRPIRK
jgi:hypothetical protein